MLLLYSQRCMILKIESELQIEPWTQPSQLFDFGFLDFPYGSAGKESACNVGDLGSVPGLGRYPGEKKGY